uniref:Statherin n=1 Tax=Catagonus wagneri TaxID=51154 RepID=A0A8C3VND9_9CETA
MKLFIFAFIMALMFAMIRADSSDERHHWKRQKHGKGYYRQNQPYYPYGQNYPAYPNYPYA